MRLFRTTFSFLCRPSFYAETIVRAFARRAVKTSMTDHAAVRSPLTHGLQVCCSFWRIHEAAKQFKEVLAVWQSRKGEYQKQDATRDVLTCGSSKLLRWKSARSAALTSVPTECARNAATTTVVRSLTSTRRTHKYGVSSLTDREDPFSVFCFIIRRRST